MNSPCKKPSRKLRALARVILYIPVGGIMNSFYHGEFNYCPFIWIFHNHCSNKKKISICTENVSINSLWRTVSYEDLLTKDRVISIHHKKIQDFAIEIFNVKNSPKIVNDLFRSETGNHYNLRLCRDFNPLLRNVIRKFGLSWQRHLIFRPKNWNIVLPEVKKINSRQPENGFRQALLVEFVNLH